MTELHNDVKTWLHKQADWLQQAAELLLSKGQLDDADITALVERLKTTAGQTTNDSRAFVELAAGASQSVDLRLKSIGEIVGIENLSPRSPLEFGTGNLCVIYGNNGSGKSGYTRLLKKAAGKPLAKDLKPNVFKQLPEQRKARITYSLDQIEHPVDWVANSPALLALQAVDIFDTETANNYLSRDNEASYTPPLVSLFKQLVTVLEQVNGKLKAQQAALQKVLPVLPAEYLQTKAGVQYIGLKAKSNPVEIQKLSTFSDVEAAELESIVQRLATADPAGLARQKQASKSQIEQIASQIKAAAPAYTVEALGAIRAKKLDAQSKRQIAKEAAQVSSAKLDGIGSETWKALWTAAREFSQTPYPNRPYPVVDDARCVLCHQELSDDAKKRLKDFETFVQGNVEREASNAEDAYQAALQQLPTALAEQMVVERCQAAGLTNETMLADIKAFWKEAEKSREALLADELVEAAQPVKVSQVMLDALNKNIEALEAQADQYDKDAAEFNRAEAIQKKIELEASKWTAQQSTAIASEVSRLKADAQFNDWIKLTNTQQITTKGGQVAEAAITEAYVVRFNSELAALKANKVKVELVKSQAAKGKTYHRLQLISAADSTVKIEDVLSEGERRIVSLAAFLADVSDKPQASTFIFDDPISSLDQDFEIAVVDRLVQLAKSRQVLIFTHRLSLLGAVDDSVKKMGEDWKKQYSQRFIETYSGVSGLPIAQPIKSAKTDGANQTLIERLNVARKAGEESGGDAYRALALGICCDFRQLIERTVESDLLAGIVVRHRRSVTTDGLLSKLPNITMGDCKFIDDLMTRFSSFVHSQSVESPVDIPAEADLRKDIEALKSWRETFKARPVQGVTNA